MCTAPGSDDFPYTPGTLAAFEQDMWAYAVEVQTVRCCPSNKAVLLPETRQEAVHDPCMGCQAIYLPLLATAHMQNSRP